ncbi:NACHT, LRR and PYD domains-containing protein 3-like [Mustelus asterias]
MVPFSRPLAKLTRAIGVATTLPRRFRFGRWGYGMILSFLFGLLIGSFGNSSGYKCDFHDALDNTTDCLTLQAKVNEVTEKMEKTCTKELVVTAIVLVSVGIISVVGTCCFMKVKYKRRRSYNELLGESTTGNSENADIKLQLDLASCTDAQLHSIIDRHRQRLELSIEDIVEDVSQMINDATVFTDAENEKIRELLGCNRRKEVCQFIFNTLLEKGPREQRKIWRIFLEWQTSKPQLNAALREIHDVGEEKSENADIKLQLDLASCTDAQLHSIIDRHRQRLELSIEDIVEDVSVSQMINDATVFTDAENEKIRELLGRNRRKEVCQFIFNTLLEKGPREQRKIWRIFLEWQTSKPQLNAALREIHDVGEEISENADIKLQLDLASCTDAQLHSIIDRHRQRLELSIEDIVEDVSQMINDATVFTDAENEKIRELLGRNRRKEVCQFIFNTLLEKGPREQRKIWRIFLEWQISKPQLNAALREIYDVGEEKSDEELMHRYCLRKRNRIMIMKTTGTEEFRSHFLDEKYTKLTIVSSLRAQKLMENELRARGREREELQKVNLKNDLEEIQLSQLMRSRSSKTECSDITFVFGAIGIGKSTMLQKIIHDWSIGKIYQQYKFVFPFKLRQLNSIDEKTCLNTLILNSFPYLENQLEYVWSEPGNILFIFDDFHEIQPTIDFTDAERDRDPQNQYFHPKCYGKISDLLRCLLKGQLLKGCSMLVTSQPWKLERLAKAQINLTAEILGFSFNETTQFVQRYFGDEHCAAEVLKSIENNEMLHALCFNPLYCTFLCSLPAKPMPKGAATPPLVRSAQVFSSFITCLFERCSYATKDSWSEFLKFGELAYEGICNTVVVFQEGQLKQHNLQDSLLSPVIMIQIPGKHPGNFVYAFAHSVLQGFFAALMKIRNATGNSHIRLLQDWQNCTDDRFQVVLRFLVALSSWHSVHVFETPLNDLPVEIQSLTSNWLQETCKQLEDKLQDERSQLMLLELLHCLLEFGERNTTIGALSQLKCMQFTKCHLQPFDYAALSRSLMDIDIIEELNLSTCDVNLEGIKQLKDVLHKIKNLRLNETKTGDSGVKMLSAALKNEACKTQILELKSNKLTDVSVQHLVSALRVNRSLIKLDLSNDSSIAEQANLLTDKCISALQGLSQNNAVLKEIRLIHNQFSPEGQLILKSFHLSDTLVLVTQ